MPSVLGYSRECFRYSLFEQGYFPLVFKVTYLWIAEKSISLTEWVRAELSLFDSYSFDNSLTQVSVQRNPRRIFRGSAEVAFPLWNTVETSGDLSKIASNIFSVVTFPSASLETVYTFSDVFEVTSQWGKLYALSDVFQSISIDRVFTTFYAGNGAHYESSTGIPFDFTSSNRSVDKLRVLQTWSVVFSPVDDYSSTVKGDLRGTTQFSTIDRSVLVSDNLLQSR